MGEGGEDAVVRSASYRMEMTQSTLGDDGKWHRYEINVRDGVERRWMDGVQIMGPEVEHYSGDDNDDPPEMVGAMPRPEDIADDGTTHGTYGS